MTRTAYICDYIRTPIGRYGGALASVRPDDLAARVFKAIIARNETIDWVGLDDIVMGCTNQAGEDNRNVARMASLLADLPSSVPARTTNRLCASGLDAVIDAYRSIAVGEADLVLAGGVESMSRAPLVMPKADKAFTRQAEIYDSTIGWRFPNPKLKAIYGNESMPETAENLAEEHNISREDQDAFAARSQKLTKKAIASGRLAKEITPIDIPQRKRDPVRIETDEHPRAETSLDKLARLPAPFRGGGSVTAGNSSGVNDGAAALLVASKAAINRFGLTPLAEIVGATNAGVEPRVMGIGPVPATKKLCDRLGMKVTDFDIIELNEAFAAQALAVLRSFGIDDDASHVNPNGGAIALGHPLGATGARLAGTAALELSIRGSGAALCTMCVGVGQGVSLALRAPA